MNARLLGGAVSLAAGLDKPGHSLSEHDPEQPLSEPHDSHEWVQADRWAECSVCGMRDYYPGGSEPCPGVPKHDQLITIDQALDLLAADLVRFREWWRVKGLETERPSMAEWAAEWFEWRRESGRRKRGKR